MFPLPSLHDDTKTCLNAHVCALIAYLPYLFRGVRIRDVRCILMMIAHNLRCVRNRTLVERSRWLNSDAAARPSSAAVGRSGRSHELLLPLLAETEAQRGCDRRCCCNWSDIIGPRRLRVRRRGDIELSGLRR
jgi:hypothetical protein